MAKQKAPRHRHASGQAPKKRRLAAPDLDLGGDGKAFLDDSDAEEPAAEAAADRPAETPAEARLRLGERRAAPRGRLRTLAALLS